MIIQRTDYMGVDSVIFKVFTKHLRFLITKEIHSVALTASQKSSHKGTIRKNRNNQSLHGQFKVLDMLQAHVSVIPLFAAF